MKVLNLYAGIGGNRKLWKDVEVTAVENQQYIADAYKKLFPEDTVVVGDAHQYLLDHFQEFDFVWSSPPCPSHSKLSTGLAGWGIYRYPDMSLYQEVIFLKHFFKGKWVVENVVPYYDVLIQPKMVIDRHFFWGNFPIQHLKHIRYFSRKISNATVGELTKGLGIELPPGTKDARKLLRNAVDPRLGLHIFETSFDHQQALLNATP
jgi:DNA (cytosine-5)-methyltransferase 1